MSNIIEPKTLPGFMELYPNEQVEFNRIKSIIENTYKKYGFYPLDTPVIESAEVLLAKAGGETEKQIYRFNKGDNDLSLRFDLTVPLAKYVAKRYNELVFPFKRYQIGKVYRGERPQKGRFREFYQCDIDVIGDEVLSFKYDSEIPSIINDIFKQLDFGPFQIRINNRKVLSGFFDYLNLNDKATDILRIVDKIDKVGVEVVGEMLEELDISHDVVSRIVEFISKKGTNDEMINYLTNLNIDNEMFKQGVAELKEVTSSMLDMGIEESNFRIDLTIARGLDYYTGTVYETILTDYPQVGSVCSGGRYENLASFYTDKKLPGVGISIGLTRLFYQLSEINLIKKNNMSSSDVMIIPMCDNYKYIYLIANKLRKNDYSVNICYTDKSNKSKFKYADRNNVKYVIVIGEDEVNTNQFTLKNMVLGTQDTMSIDALDTLKLDK